MVEAGPSSSSSFCLTVRECNKQWALAFDLERTMADRHEHGSLDCDELQAFVELLTRDPAVVTALSDKWDPR